MAPASVNCYPLIMSSSFYDPGIKFFRTRDIMPSESRTTSAPLRGSLCMSTELMACRFSTVGQKKEYKTHKCTPLKPRMLDLTLE